MKQGGRSAATSSWLRKLEKNIEKEPRHLTPALQYIQAEAGYLPPEAMASLAKHLGVSEAKVYGVASFYAQFHFEPRGRNTVTVCRGTACHVRGSGPLLKELETRLGVAAGGTTESLDYSLETVACFGSCALAPVVVLNGVVHRQQTTASVSALVEAGGATTGKRKPKKTTGAGKKPKGRAHGRRKKGARS
jgi:NADH:ubiquinone oxidoreductase subunit E